MKNKRLTTLQILALNDLSMFAGVGAGILWRVASRHIPLWVELLLLCLAFVLHRLYRRRFVALTRLARRMARKLPMPQRRVRYYWVCGQVFGVALIVAWIIPFGFTTAAFWCIYITALVVLVVLLEVSREELLGAA